MKKLLLILLSALSLTAFAQDKKTVAVLDPICRDNSVNAFFQQMVRGAMESAVTASSEYEAYDRSAFDMIQKEQAFQRTGVVSDSQIKKMGEMAGVDFVLVSEVSAYEGYLSAVVKILNVTTGKYDKSVDDFTELNPNAVKSKCREMAESMFGKVPLDSRPQSSAKPMTKAQDNNEQVNYSPEELYKKDPSWKENPLITDECIIDISLMHDAVRKERYAEAENIWSSVYEKCPNANKSIYTDGAKILRWKYENLSSTASVVERKECVEKLVELHDKRIFYFGNDPKYTIAYILGEKGVDYYNYAEWDTIREKAYPWLKESVAKLQDKSEIDVLMCLFEVSRNLYKYDSDKYKSQYNQDYSTVYNILSKKANNSKGANANILRSKVQYIEDLYIKSEFK